MTNDYYCARHSNESYWHLGDVFSVEIKAGCEYQRLLLCFLGNFGHHARQLQHDSWVINLAVATLRNLMLIPGPAILGDPSPWCCYGFQD